MMRLSIVAVAILALAAVAAGYSAPQPTGDIECVACEFIVQKLEGLLENNATMSEIEAELAKLCGDLPATLSAVCNDVVDNYLPELIAALLNKENPQQVCTSVGICTSTVAAPEDECSVCTLIATEVYALLQNNATESQIISALEHVCSLLPSNDVAICDNLVSSYLPQIIEMLENDFTPSQICADLGLCSSRAVVDVTAAPQGAECSICELIVGEVEKLLANNHTEAEIEGLLEKICAALPGSFGSICNTLVQTYLPEIIAALENDVPPEAVCEKIGICTSGVAAPQSECSICELIVGEVESLLANNHTESEIIAALDKVCAALPGSFGATCQTLVNNFLPEIIMELENNLPANVVCQKIGICTSAKVAAPQSECSICELLVGEIETLLASNKSESFIIMELEKLCALLPGSLGQTCNTLVEADLPAIIEHLEAGNPPSAVCTKLGRCTSAKAAVAKVMTPQSECSICELLVGEIETLLASNKSESFIIMELEKLCALLPGSLGQTCNTLVEADLPAIIEHLEAGNPPSAVCTKLGRCTSSVAAPAMSPEVCQICELVVTEAEKLVAGKTLNNTAILDELKALCGDLPTTYQPECDAVVTLLGMTIIEEIENGTPPETVCTNIKLCTSVARKSALHVAAAVPL